MIEEERLTLSQEEARELVKFERETEIINQINIEKSFEENRHLFKLIKESRFTRVGKELGYLSIDSLIYAKLLFTMKRTSFVKLRE